MAYFNKITPAKKTDEIIQSQNFFQSQLLFATQDLNFNNQDSFFFSRNSAANQPQNFSDQNDVSTSENIFSQNDSIFTVEKSSSFSQNNDFASASFCSSQASECKLEFDNEKDSDGEKEEAIQNFSIAVSSTCTKRSKYSSLTNNLIQDIDGDVIPKSIISLYHEVKKEHSDWTFINILVGQLCTDILPMGAYHNLKLALLMSLVSQSEQSMLHIVAMGQNTCDVHLVIKSLGKFAKKFLTIHSQCDGITINKNEKTEAAYIGDWTRFSSKIVSKFVREIETSNIIVDKVQKSYQLQSTIWSYWSCSGNMKNDMNMFEQFLK
jgi:hypothetical protein